jgi:hypothetical protein
MDDRECIKMLILLAHDREKFLKRALKNYPEGEIYQSELERIQQARHWLEERVNEDLSK